MICCDSSDVSTPKKAWDSACVVGLRSPRIVTGSVTFGVVLLWRAPGLG